MKTRILFVDDEPNVLEGLRNRLHRQRKKWDMHFASSGADALALLATQPMDVIVTDMRMPGMDGAALLAAVKQAYPGMVRIVLSGHAELATALRAVPVAHQFLTKPCEAGVIEATVERACNLQAIITDPVVERVVGGVDHLPPAPRIYAQLVAALAKEDVTAADVGALVRQDIALGAKLLQIANSSFFRLSRKISSIEEAVTYLGFDTIKHLVLATEAFGDRGKTTVGAAVLDAMQRHGMVTGTLASAMLTDRASREEAFVAGLLHDVGELLLLTEAPDRAAAARQEAVREGIPLHEAEHRLWGVCHAEVGGYLLALWGLPYPIVEAVANHHTPLRVAPPGRNVLSAVHLADALAAEVEASHGADAIAPPAVDPRYADALGLEGGLDGWRVRADRLAGGAGTPG
jgi:HD-like signal output (HDOD) protein